MFRWVLVVGVLLASCSSPEIFITDSVQEAAAPEITRAWLAWGWPFSSPVLRVAATEDLSAIDQYLSGATAARAVLFGFAVPEPRLAEWKRRAPDTRFAVLTAQGVPGPSATLVRLNRMTAWSLLLTRAGASDGPDAVALAWFPTGTSQTDVAALAALWKAKHPSGDLRGGPPGTFVADVSSLFALDPAVVTLPPNLPEKVKVHTTLGAALALGAERVGWSLRLNPSLLAATLHAALSAPVGSVIDLPLEAYERELQ
jgi:hypothetical protein